MDVELPEKFRARFNKLQQILEEEISEFSKFTNNNEFSFERKKEYDDKRRLIEDYLKEMDEINDHLENLSQPTQVNYDIAAYYKSMYKKLNDVIKQDMERKMLLGKSFGIHNSALDTSMDNGIHSALNEFESANRGNSLLIDMINNANAARDSLRNQLDTLTTTQSRFYEMNSLYQSINNLTHRIAVRSRRNQYIVGAVIVFGFIGLLFMV